MQLFYGHINQDRFSLHESEINHCIRVLRKGTGDTIHFITGNGNLYVGVIDVASKRVVEGSYTLKGSTGATSPTTLLWLLRRQKTWIDSSGFLKSPSN